MGGADRFRIVEKDRVVSALLVPRCDEVQAGPGTALPEFFEPPVDLAIAVGFHPHFLFEVDLLRRVIGPTLAFMRL